MRLLAEQARLLVRHLPARRSMQAEAAAFNLQNESRLEEIRDFALLPFALNQREESFWQSIRGAALPDSLERRIEQFKSRGRFVAYDHELFDRQQWIEAFIALGVVPDRVDPQAEKIDMNKVRSSLKGLAEEFAKTIAAAPKE
jgi:tryptophan halogenase